MALASYVIFSPEQQPDASSIAAALATVLLPFSVLGPFVGVFLDRWSRRQVLAWSNFARVALVTLLAVGLAGELRGPWLFALILACLSVNRFLLAALSAALPHVVAHDELITANAVTPTGGTLAFIVGLGFGTVARTVWSGAGLDGDVGALASAAVLYGVAGALALRIPRDLLGPDLASERPAVREAVRHVARGLLEGLRHLGQRRPAAYGLATIGAHRFFYGISTVATILLYRNYFYAQDDAEGAFAGLTLAVLVAGLGFVLAAVLTPLLARRVTSRTWILLLLTAAAVTEVFPGAFYTETTLLVASFFLGLASQGIKICVDTLVQTGVEDAYRGRVFSLYDVIFNVAFVAAAAVGALVLPENGKSYVVLGAISLGYALTAFGYALVTRQPADRVTGDLVS
ncbi:MAG: MFS transporter [Actinomycetota bacterium]|nr:MFS transporter [Actinomycetota bacterium]